MTMICSISGVPRMIQTNVLTAPRRGAQRLMEPNATTSPSGRENTSVQKKSSQLSRNAPERRSRITVTNTHPSIQTYVRFLLRQSQTIFLGQSAHGAIGLELVKGGVHSGGHIAALAECPGPLAVISADTAISIMGVNAKQELVGGAILPGPQLSLASLVQKTAQLPQIDLSAPAPASVLGKNTASCLQNGFVLGTAGLLDGLADRFRAELGPEAKFYATGSLPRSIREACRTPIHYRETLITDGLYQIWLRNRKG